MNFNAIEAIADAVLFEGYILYPYRPSALKNRQRWNFGTLYPRIFAEAQSPQERCGFRAEVIVEANAKSRLSGRIRFLQLDAPSDPSDEGWEEGFARSCTFEDIAIDDLLRGIEKIIDLSGLSTEEALNAPVSFREGPRFGKLNLHATSLLEGAYRLVATFANESDAPAQQSFSRREVQDVAFTSAHLLLGIEDGSFVSLLEPQPEYEAEVKGCAQDGVFPVLAGNHSERNCMLCSPIILYDYPEVAPESAGNFFDGTEMDEMLALRVLTLTDEEKEEMRRGDPHARAILNRPETLPAEQLARVHGAVRGLRRMTSQPVPDSSDEVDMIKQIFDPYADHKPVECVRVFGIELRTGDRVRLWPQKKADILDLEMEGKIAIIEAIEQDFEDNLQFAVVLEDDPGRDLGMLRQTGHRFFFSPEEVEPVALEAS